VKYGSRYHCWTYESSKYGLMLLLLLLAAPAKKAKASHQLEPA
jgi:hypothetical protein